MLLFPRFIRFARLLLDGASDWKDRSLKEKKYCSIFVLYQNFGGLIGSIERVVVGTIPPLGFRDIFLIIRKTNLHSNRRRIIMQKKGNEA